MSEESPISNPELYEAIDSAIEKDNMVGGKKKRGKARKKQQEENEYPPGLEKMTGKDVIQALDFLHRRYLSWLTEAEAAKYAVVYKSAKEDVLKEMLELNAELMKQNQQLIQELHNLADKLRMQPIMLPASKEKESEKEKPHPLDDPRIRSLIYILLEIFAGDKKAYQSLRPIIAQALMPEAFQESKTNIIKEIEDKDLKELEDLLESEKENREQEEGSPGEN